MQRQRSVDLSSTREPIELDRCPSPRDRRRKGISSGFTACPARLFPGLPMTRPVDPTTLRRLLAPPPFYRATSARTATLPW